MSDNNLFRSLLKVWEQTSVPARIAGTGMAVISIALVVAVAYWSMQPHYVPLVNNLSPQQAAEIVSLLDDKGISNKLNFSGSGILVDQGSWSTANQLADTIVDSSQLESSPFASSLINDPTTADHRLNRDLELRLEKTISQLKNIENARVHLGVPEQTPFVNRKKDKTASITVQIRQGRLLNRKLSRSIINSVAKSVEGLNPENISLSDTEGNSYSVDDSASGIVDGQMEYRQHYENELERNAESMLESALGPGRAVVRVTAEIDFTQIQQTETRYDPDAKVLKTENTTTSKGTTADPLAGGPAGTASNLAGGRGSQGSRAVVMNEETREVAYENGTMVEIKTQHPGAVKRLTIAAMVQLVEMPVESTDEDAEPATTPPMQVLTQEEAERLIKQAVGFDPTRADEIEVLSVPKLAGEIPLIDIIDTPAVIDSWMPLIKNISLGVAALVALIIGLMTIKRMKPIEIANTESGTVTPQRARQLSDLATLARKNPELLSSIMSAWLNDEKVAAPAGAASTQARKAA